MSSFSIFSVFDAWFVPGFLAEDDIRCIMVTDFVKRKYSFRFDLVWFVMTWLINLSSLLVGSRKVLLQSQIVKGIRILFIQSHVFLYWVDVQITR